MLVLGKMERDPTQTEGEREKCLPAPAAVEKVRKHLRGKHQHITANNSIPELSAEKKSAGLLDVSHRRRDKNLLNPCNHSWLDGFS
jgi:hypothetical protein